MTESESHRFTGRGGAVPAAGTEPGDRPATRAERTGEGDGAPAGAARRQWANSAAHWQVLTVAACTLLALAAGFAVIVAENPAHPPLVGLDKGWGSLLRPSRDAVLTVAAEGFSYLAGPLGGTVIAIGVALFLWFFRGRRVAAALLAITPAITSGASQLIKHLVLRARPGGGLVAADTGSFPSGHVITTLAVGLALTLVLLRPGRRRWALAGVGAATLVMIWCRTYLGVHWISDTLESIFVSAGLVLALWVILGGWVGREAERRGGRTGTRRLAQRDADP
jgi:membrane-associated phospholipid phosphatase